MRVRRATTLLAAAVILGACSSDADTATDTNPTIETGTTSSQPVTELGTTTTRLSGVTTTTASTTSTTTIPGTDSTTKPTSGSLELNRVSYDPTTDAVIAHTSLGEIRSSARELPNGPGSGTVWGVVDFDGNGLPEILTLDPEGAHHLWTSIYRITRDGLVLSDAFRLGGSESLTGAADCQDRTGDGIADLTIRDAYYDEGESLWRGTRTEYEYIDGNFIDDDFVEIERPGPKAMDDETKQQDADVFGPTTCSPLPAGPEGLAQDIALGDGGRLGADDIRTRFDDPSVVDELERVTSIQGPFSVASCDEPTDQEGECWLLAETTEVSLTMTRSDWDTGWHVTDAHIVDGE
ncbi:MAG: hypothetical protein GY745_15960 [Actinomycetia bacterium]|nr:hypothetical protein [Actinomycetes bacterium]MCP4086529.1 hypothetical protein [Actinomycetes bacterium]